MIRISYLIRSLETGGAERQIVALASALDRRAFAPTVMTFYPEGPLRASLAEADVPVVCLEKRGRWDLFGFTARLRREIARTRPHILHSYLTTANLMGLLAAPRTKASKLVWSKRASALDSGHYDVGTRATEWLEARLAGRPDLVVVNSEAGRRDYLADGARPARLAVVPNGIDLARFRPHPEARNSVRADWGIDATAPLIGMMARIDPMKGHDVFLEAAALSLKQRPDLRFVCIGAGAPALSARLRSQAESLGLGDSVVWAGERDDVAEVLSSLDLHCSASRFGEGFSNAIGEAMAAGIPCVATDVGDAARIVGDTGRVVAPEDPAALSRACLELMAQDGDARRGLGERCRARIAREFSLEAMVEKMAEIYRGLLAPSAEEREG